MKCWVCDNQNSVGSFFSIGFSEKELKKLIKPKHFPSFKRTINQIAEEKIGMIKMCLPCARKLEYDVHMFEDWATEWREIIL